MDSLSLYMYFYQNSGFDREEKRLSNADEVIHLIYNEILTPPFDMVKSSFVNETVRLLDKIKNETTLPYRKTEVSSISTIDAYVIVQGLLEYVRNQQFTAVNVEYRRYARYLFSGVTFQGTQKNEMVQVNQWLKDIQQIVVKKKRTAEGTSPDESKLKDSAVKQYQSNGIDIEKNEHENAKHSSSIMAESQKELAKRMELRMKNNQSSIQLWHDEQAAISSQLLEMQPAVSKLLETFMSFSDELTESYVLQFAKMQIELFNIISDAYIYHQSVSERSGNKDYIKAVLNYEDFKLFIIDNLAAFGVEEITSRRGTRFDGAVHEVVDNDSFSPRLSLIKESLQTGFKYKDIVIQKEKVSV